MGNCRPSTLRVAAIAAVGISSVYANSAPMHASQVAQDEGAWTRETNQAWAALHCCATVSDSVSRAMRSITRLEALEEGHDKSLQLQKAHEELKKELKKAHEEPQADHDRKYILICDQFQFGQRKAKHWKSNPCREYFHEHPDSQYLDWVTKSEQDLPPHDLKGCKEAEIAPDNICWLHQVVFTKHDASWKTPEDVKNNED